MDDVTIPVPKIRDQNPSLASETKQKAPTPPVAPVPPAPPPPPPPPPEGNKQLTGSATADRKSPSKNMPMNLTSSIAQEAAKKANAMQKRNRMIQK